MKQSSITISPQRIDNRTLCQCPCGGSPRIDRDFRMGFLVYCPRCHRHTSDAPRAIHESEAVAEWEVDICKNKIAVARELVKLAKKIVAVKMSDAHKYALSKGWDHFGKEVARKGGYVSRPLKLFGPKVNFDVDEWNSDNIRQHLPQDVIDELIKKTSDPKNPSWNFWESVVPHYKQKVAQPRRSDFDWATDVLKKNLPDFDVKQSKYEYKLSPFHSGIRWHVTINFRLTPRDVEPTIDSPRYGKGQWFLYDKWGFAPVYQDWKRGPKYVRVERVTTNYENAYHEYELHTFSLYGDKENETIMEKEHNLIQDHHYEPIEKPRFRDRPLEMNPKAVEDIADRMLRGWDREGNQLEWSTREHGDVGNEEPGEEDIRQAKEFGRAVMKEVPGASVQMEVVDEFVHVSVSQKK